MYCVTVRFTVAAGQMPAFLPLMRRQAETSVADEPGCLRFEVWADPARTDQIWLHEVYANRAAFDAHLASAHFRAFDSVVAPLVAAKSVETWAQAEAGLAP